MMKMKSKIIKRKGKEKGKGKRNRTNKWKFNMMKMKSSKGNWTGRKGQLFLHLFLKYIYAYVNKSILKLNICVRLSVSVLLHYNCKINANIQGVYHRPKLERSTRRYIGTALRGALYSLCYLLFVVCM